MTKNNFNNPNYRPRILVAPLDWGLGHATRCIPIIKELISLDCEVYIAADKAVRYLLEKEFPTLVFLRCKGYEISYIRNPKFFNWKLVVQTPKILLRSLKEHSWLKKIIQEFGINAVISDNRPGMFHKSIPSVYMTHQLQIKTGNLFTGALASRIHSFFIRKYHRCWVPDCKEGGLAGALSHPTWVPSTVTYIGPLSRMRRMPGMKKEYDLLLLISGPEPQRSIFENNLLKEAEHYQGKIILVRGIPGSSHFLPASPPSWTIKNHLPAEELNEVMAKSDMIIARSGYTTVMDLAAMGKKAVLVPTPGQSEQQYLGQYLLDKKYFYAVEEKYFSIRDSLKKATDFDWKPVEIPEGLYKKTVQEFVLSLKTMKFATQ